MTMIMTTTVLMMLPTTRVLIYTKRYVKILNQIMNMGLKVNNDA